VTWKQLVKGKISARTFNRR